MKISKNRWRGALITDLNELVSLAEDKLSVVVFVGGIHCVRPAAFIVFWPLATILRTKIYHSLDYDPKKTGK